MLSELLQLYVKDKKPATCDQHGDYESSLMTLKGIDHWTGCVKCIKNKQKQDSIAWQKQDALQARENSLKSVIRRANIPDAFDVCKFEDYRLYNSNEKDADKQKLVLNICKEFADNFAHAKDNKAYGGMFLGGTGTSKTFLSVCIIRRIMELGFSGAFVTMQDIIFAIKSTYDKNSDLKEMDVLKPFLDIDLLIIDEVGISASEHELEKLYYIINNRYNSVKPTILLSNTMTELEKKIGSRVVSRLEQSGFILNFTWKDYRRMEK